MMIKIQNYIDGKLIPPASGEHLENINPALGKVYSYIPDSDTSDVQAAVKAAQAAFDQWSTSSIQERAAVMNKIADLIDRDAN